MPRVLANQDLTDSQLALWGLSRRDVTRSLWWVRGRRRWPGHVAVGHLLLGSNRAWPIVGVLILWSPLRPVARATYRLVAWSRPWISQRVIETMSGRDDGQSRQQTVPRALGPEVPDVGCRL